MAAPAYIPDSLQRRGVTEVFLREGIANKLNIGITAVEVTGLDHQVFNIFTFVADNFVVIFSMFISRQFPRTQRLCQ